MSFSAFLRLIALLLVACGGSAFAALVEADAEAIEVIVSVPDQRMVVLRDGAWLKRYKISTSRFGLGDNFGSYKTPVGRLRVCEKVGGDLPAGAVIKHREATGEILSPNSPGRDPIVSRIMWLAGLEPQNDNARARGIYIHGTTEEAKIGQPVSWGCIRMRTQDVMELYEIIPVGVPVTISEDDLPRFSKWKPAPPPPPPVIIAAIPTPAPAVVVASIKPATRERKPAVVAEPPMLPEKPVRVAATVRRTIPPLRSISTNAEEAPDDSGNDAAFQGSILFAGLPDAPKPRLKLAPKANEPVASILPETPARPVALVLNVRVESPSLDAFSLAATVSLPALRLIDLRRVEVLPELTMASMFTAPAPPRVAVRAGLVAPRPEITVVASPQALLRP